MILPKFSIILQHVSWSFQVSLEVAASLSSTEAMAGGILIGGNRLRSTCTNASKVLRHLSVENDGKGSLRRVSESV